MSKHHGSWRVLGLSAAALLLSAVACSDDDDDSPSDVGGRAGSAGASTGGSKAGMPGTAGSKSPIGGETQGGAAGASPMTAGGEGGSLVEAGAGPGGSSGSAGDTGSLGGAGMAGAGGDPGVAGEGGQGGAGPSNPEGCDYSEANADQDEETGLVASDVVQVICANANNGDYEPVEGLVDRDGFDVEVPAGSDALIKLELSDPQALGETHLYVNGLITYAVDGRAAFRHRYDSGDLATIAVRTYNGEDLAAPLAYKLSIVVDDVDARCPASAATANFVEANDGAGRDNDVYQFSNGFVASFTAGSDTAEPTAITVAAPPQSYRVTGSSADVSFIGPYFDGDSFAFRTGPDVTQLTIRGDWPGDDRDFDFFLFEAGSEIDRASAFETGTVSDEYLTATVQPDTDYVLWMGLYEGTQPSAYSLTLCSEDFSLLGE
jgi:hypothetical protein